MQTTMRRGWRLTVAGGGAAAVAVALLSSGCGGDDEGTAGGTGGGGGAGGSSGSGGVLLDGGTGGSGGTGASGTGGSGGIDPLTGCGSNLTGIVRDFRSDHPDFECTKSTQYVEFTDPYDKDCGPWDPAIVGALGSPIGPDRKPGYAGGSATLSTTGQANFLQWFVDVPGVNAAADLRLDLSSAGGGTFVFDTDRFFPIDGELFDADPSNPDHGPFRDDDANIRNFHFTYELHTTFKYEPGNVFTFRGDDDVFVYIADKLVVNLGGIHVPLQASLNLDTGRLEVTAPMGFPDLALEPALGFTESIQGGVAATMELGLVAGTEYKMDFFFAERNCCASNFRVETNLVFVQCGTGTPK